MLLRSSGMREMRDWRVLSRWRAIPSCPGYEASDYGRIYSVRTKRLLGGTTDRYGYAYVNIMVGDSKVKRKVHRLVCEAWHGSCPSHHECGHLDGTRDNNRADNLSWITRSENGLQMAADGRASKGPEPMRGEANARAKLTTEQVREMRQLAADGAKYRELASQFEISIPQVGCIVRRERWAHVQ